MNFKQTIQINKCIFSDFIQCFFPWQPSLYITQYIRSSEAQRNDKYLHSTTFKYEFSLQDKSLSISEILLSTLEARELEIMSINDNHTDSRHKTCGGCFYQMIEKNLYLLKYFSSPQDGRELKNKSRNIWQNYGRTERIFLKQEIEVELAFEQHWFGLHRSTQSQNFFFPMVNITVLLHQWLVES